MNSVNDIITKKVNKSGKLRGKLNGFTMIANWFIEQSGFSIYEKMVVIVIKKHLMYKSQAWPSLEKISTQAGCSISSVKKAIRELEQKQILIRVKHKTVWQIYFGRTPMATIR